MDKENGKTQPAKQMQVLRLRMADSEDAAAGFAAETVQDAIAIERPVNIEINGQLAAVVMALPGSEEELAAGFVLGHGLVRNREDLLLLRACEPEPPSDGKGDAAQWPVRVKVVVPVFKQPDTPGPLIVRYACGAVGEGSSPPRQDPIALGLKVKAQSLKEMLADLSAGQEAFRTTGGTHAAGLFEAGGKLLIVREDIGRHNAIDRVLGRALLEEIELSNKVLITTGRASADLVFKALSARLPILASLSAPTALAADWAKEGGLTLIGFLRPRRFNIYTWPERILN
ncbi:MAG: formate dehydrogenase accessory sulfurtransferase FdhD [Armatimonadetes bacterium]|nr:formate dehydrogenase accessory sulfurtransferase FdhD [Armatimonadota bacterium]NIM24672.1 formate dehydrogenase accessory sulfurtransferase FdhD [Armatimonadota bacterium]NIM68551.1 formate dehydrogenase accessory sulfurtransferase FdhD [Armatimonadota bacterium]NIM76931.1 formate dehydrogenase accessory sulfurtransferase FdhD [Armatimonadota bacterium]NIN06745.1 formate dehydrogenase accessory sulfurtransferase FdhD [Armatimonadota bacterium]